MEIFLYMLLIFDTKIYISRERAEKQMLNHIAMIELTDDDVDGIYLKLRYREAPDKLVKTIKNMVNYGSRQSIGIPSSAPNDNSIGMDRFLAFNIKRENSLKYKLLERGKFVIMKIKPRDDNQQKQVKNAYDEYKVARETAQTTQGKGYFRRMFEAVLKLIGRKKSNE